MTSATTAMRRVSVEVKIGVQFAPRELVLESAQSPAEIADAVAKAMGTDGVLTLVDEKGRQIIVPVSNLAYVEIDEQVPRKVGFIAG
jgi:hypothetical protein